MFLRTPDGGESSAGDHDRDQPVGGPGAIVPADGREHDDHGGHGHAHGPGGHGHGHRPAPDADARYLRGALALILGFMAVEVLIGVLSSSLALVSDAGHMLTDALALALALIAMRFAAKPAAGRLTFGWKRLEIFSAQVNGIALLVLVAIFVYSAVERLIDPPAVAGLPVLVTALIGIVVNIGATTLLARADRSSLNIQGAFAHILSDLYAFVATAGAGLIVLVTGFNRADPIAALVVAALMARAGLRLVRDSGRVFLEAAPLGMDPDEIGAALAGRPAVAEVHDLHGWEVTSGLPALSAHVRVAARGACHTGQRDRRRLLAERWRIDHVTLQVDHVGDADDDHADHDPPAHDGPDQGDGTSRPGPTHCADPHGPVHRPT
ncbi:MAG: cation diffusion facilitator family transporter [Frankia sp.]